MEIHSENFWLILVDVLQNASTNIECLSLSIRVQVWQ